MDIVISKAELSRLLYFSQSVVERRSTIPILANVLISAQDGKLRLSASDLEITTVTSASAKVNTKGSTTVNAKVFSDIVKELPDTDVHIKLTDGERIEIKAANSKWRMIGVSAEEYPSLPGIGFETKSRISAPQLVEMIAKTSYAVSLDETRFNLNGVCFEMVGDKGKKGERSLRMVATDGHRLAMVTRPAKGNLSFEGSVIVPRKGLTEIRKLLELVGDAEVGVDIIEGFLVVESGDTKISTRLIDGEFPDYNQVIPKQKGSTVTMRSGDLAQALRRVALMVTDKGKCVKLDFSSDTLRVSSSSPELGEASEELAVQFKGTPFSAGFNAKYLIDITASVGEEGTLAAELNGELGPGKFYPESDESSVAVVMPMRLT